MFEMGNTCLSAISPPPTQKMVSSNEPFGSTQKMVSFNETYEKNIVLIDVLSPFSSSVVDEESLKNLDTNVQSYELYPDKNLLVNKRVGSIDWKIVCFNTEMLVPSFVQNILFINIPTKNNLLEKSSYVVELDFDFSKRLPTVTVMKREAVHNKATILARSMVSVETVAPWTEPNDIVKLFQFYPKVGMVSTMPCGSILWKFIFINTDNINQKYIQKVFILDNKNMMDELVNLDVHVNIEIDYGNFDHDFFDHETQVDPIVSVNAYSKNVGNQDSFKASAKPNDLASSLDILLAKAITIRNNALAGSMISFYQESCINNQLVKLHPRKLLSSIRIGSITWKFISVNVINILPKDIQKIFILTNPIDSLTSEITNVNVELDFVDTTINQFNIFVAFNILSISKIITVDTSNRNLIFY